MPTSDNEEGTMAGLVAPTGGVVVGTMYLISGILVLAQTAADAAATFTGKFRGLIKNAVKHGATGKAFVVGQIAYWDATNKRFTPSATGNTARGYAASVAAATDTVVDIILLN